MNGIYLYFVNKHGSRWPLLGLQVHLDTCTITICLIQKCSSQEMVNLVLFPTTHMWNKRFILTLDVDSFDVFVIIVKS